MEDEMFQTPAHSSQHCTNQKTLKLQDLEKYIESLSSKEIESMLGNFGSEKSYEGMSYEGLQKELIKMANVVCPDDPLSFIKDLNCLMEPADQTEDEQEENDLHLEADFVEPPFQSDFQTTNHPLLDSTHQVIFSLLTCCVKHMSLSYL